jgi:hypothetical protein
MDNIKMDLLEIGLTVADWIGLAQDRCRWRARERGNEPSGSIKSWETIEWLHNLWPLEWYSAPEIIIIIIIIIMIKLSLCLTN